MKRFSVPCLFNEHKFPFNIYIGTPTDEFHPLHFQSAWLAKERSGQIPADVMDSFAKLYRIARENNVSFEELAVYAVGSTNQEQQENS